MSEVLDRYAVLLRTGFREHWAANPWRISVVTTWPRAVLQCLFFTLVGAAANGANFRFAFVGATAVVIAQPMCVGVPRIPTTDRVMGTFFRIRLGRIPPILVAAVRATPWLLEAMLVFVCGTAIIGLVTGQFPLALRLLALVPVYLVMALTGLAAGLAIGSFALGYNADVLLANALTYLIIAAGGAVVPVDRVPWLNHLGSMLPTRNGLLAVRALLIGRSWGTHLLAEVGVCGLWVVVAVVGFWYHSVYARRKGFGASA